MIIFVFISNLYNVWISSNVILLAAAIVLRVSPVKIVRKISTNALTKMETKFISRDVTTVFV